MSWLARDTSNSTRFARGSPDAREIGAGRARAHLSGADDGLVTVQPLLDLVPVWSGLLRQGLSDTEGDLIRSRTRTGRPLGESSFVECLESDLDRVLKPRRPGRKPKETGAERK